MPLTVSTAIISPGPSRPFSIDLGVVDGEQADFGAEGEEAVLGDLVAGGTQAVAVEARADGAAVAEDQRGGAVPRLVERLVIFVKILHLGRRRGIALPRGGHEHEHGVEHDRARP